jgi:hypothetical protein
MSVGGGQGLLLARDGQALCRIVVVAADNKAARAAGEELGRYLSRITGAQFEVSRERGPANILVGSASDFAPLPFEADLSRYQSFALRSWGDDLYVLGSDERAVWFAVYDLLERLGCRWFMPGEIGEVVPHAPELWAPPLEVSEAPAFLKRSIWYSEDNSQEGNKRLAQWQVRNKVADYPLWHSHNLNSLAPPDRYFGQHPEYYALVGGKRQPTQICTTNPEVREIAVETVLDYFKEHPEATSYSLSPEDNADFCECERCRALDSGARVGPYPDVSQRMIEFFNYLAERVTAVYPDKVFGFYCVYMNFREPPKRRLHPALVPVITAQGFCSIHSIADRFCPERQEMRRIIEGWKAVSSQFYIREYDPPPWHGEIPDALYGMHLREMPVYAELGARGFSWEGHQSWIQALPSYYICAKMMWNPQADGEALLRDFYDKFFAETAEPMGRYFTRLEQCYRQVRHHPGWSDLDYLSDFSEQDMRYLRAALREARQAAQREMVRRRVQMVDLGFRYLAAVRDAQDYTGRVSVARRIRAAEQAARYVDLLASLNEDFIAVEAAKRRVARLRSEAMAAYPDSVELQRTGNLRFDLPKIWRFRQDSEAEGEALGWWRPDFDDSGWETVSTESQWCDQGRHGMTGRGWARVRFTPPKEFGGRRALLFFGALDEGGIIYLNGVPVQNTDDLLGHQWDVPFQVDVTAALRPGEENVLAVHAWSEGTLGGVWRPVVLCTVGADWPAASATRWPGPSRGDVGVAECGPMAARPPHG